MSEIRNPSTQVAAGYRKSVSQPFDQVLARVKELLQAEGFGVLTEIDVAGTLKQKIGHQLGRRYTILGVCKPQFAAQALAVEPEVGLMMPCTIIAYEADGATVVSALDPEVALRVVGECPALAGIGRQAKETLTRVIDQL